MRQRFGDGCAICTPIRFRDSIGRLSRNKTPVADAQNIVKIILLLPGEQAARVRAQVSEVFVRFPGGDVTLVQDVMRNRELQDTLRDKDPDHWARLFGEHVEATSSAGSVPPPQQELVQKACEAVVQAAIPAIERMVGAISQRFAEALNAQAEAQRTMLDQLLEASRRQVQGRPLVTINTASHF